MRPFSIFLGCKTRLHGKTWRCAWKSYETDERKNVPLTARVGSRQISYLLYGRNLYLKQHCVRKEDRAMELAKLKDEKKAAAIRQIRDHMKQLIEAYRETREKTAKKLRKWKLKIHTHIGDRFIVPLSNISDSGATNLSPNAHGIVPFLLLDTQISLLYDKYKDIR